jgi:hypothetical protein
VTSRNVSLVHQYLEAVSSFAPFETVRAFFASDILIEEHPNLIAPRGRIRRAADLPAAYELGCQILKSQSYRVKHIIEAGDELAVQLEWTGILAVPVMNLPAESEMKAFVAMFLTSAKAKSPFSEITTVTRLSIRHPHPHKAPLSRSLLPFRAFHHLSNGQLPFTDGVPPSLPAAANFQDRSSRVRRRRRQQPRHPFSHFHRRARATHRYRRRQPLQPVRFAGSPM